LSYVGPFCLPAFRTFSIIHRNLKKIKSYKSVLTFFQIAL